MYIGESKRPLHNRLQEHEAAKIESVVTKHMRDYGHTFNFKNTKILDNEPNYKKRIFSEMIHICNNKNSINKKEDIKSLNYLYKPIIRKLKL